MGSVCSHGGPFHHRSKLSSSWGRSSLETICRIGACWNMVPSVGWQKSKSVGNLVAHKGFKPTWASIKPMQVLSHQACTLLRSICKADLTEVMIFQKMRTTELQTWD